jgi:hypothetical protein
MNKTGRRAFLGSIGALITAVGVRYRRGVHAEPEGPPIPLPGSGSGTPNISAITVGYLPPTYRESNRMSFVVDGFTSGPHEMKVVYHTPTIRRHYHPLMMFLTLEPVTRGLSLIRLPATLVDIRGAAGAHDFEGASMAVTNAQGTIISLVYYDGYWRRSPAGPFMFDCGGREIGYTWDRRDLHAVVASHGRHVIGIRGSRSAGVSRDDLIAMTESIRFYNS